MAITIQEPISTPHIRIRRRKMSALTRSKKPGKPAKTPRTRKPEGMSLEDWQTALRREFGREQDFRLENLGVDPIFSVFRVTNPATKGVYQVTIRGPRPGDNHCTCPDFAINTLGTCKHVEFTLGRLEKTSGGLTALEGGRRPSYSEVLLHYDAQRHVTFQPGSDCPLELRRVADRYFRDGRLREEAYERFDGFLKQAHATGHELRCHDDALGFIARVRDRAALRRRLDEAYPRGLTDAAVRKLLKVPLYPYQREGALFAARAGRALIADDMGLGKTIQAIAAAELLARHGGAERALIVCPTSLKHQWKREIEKFTGRSAVVVEGGLRRRAELYRDGNGAFFKIVNYDVVHRDLEAIAGWSPDLVILDEAQRI